MHHAIIIATLAVAYFLTTVPVWSAETVEPAELTPAQLEKKDEAIAVTTEFYNMILVDKASLLLDVDRLQAQVASLQEQNIAIAAERDSAIVRAETAEARVQELQAVLDDIQARLNSILTE